ncbi:MAG: DUF2341 domain-containing protein [Sediminibacterium sp.]|nr:DUF2341 domain-containing protein [Sediminibacterium sp.]
MKKHIYFIITPLLVLLTTLAYAQPAGWSYVKQIKVVNTATNSAINYQLKLTVNTQSFIAASQMLATGDDIRFGKTCNGATLYNYWIENGINTPTTNIWVKIDTIPAGGSRIFYMFYGNAAATATSAVVGVFNGPHSATDSVATGASGGATNSQRGFRFTPTEDLLVTHFGKREPNGTPRTVTLFDFATQAIVNQFTVTGAAAQYNYNTLTNPIWLVNGTQYILSLYQGPADGYYFGTSSQIGQHMTYGDMRYCNSCAANTFPTNVLSNFHYGYPDLWYFTKNTITPAPTYTFDFSQQSVTTVTASASALCAGSSATLNASNSTGGLTYSWTPGSLNGASVSVTPSVTTTYTVTASLAGCNLTFPAATVSLNVNAAPVISVNSGAVCNGQSYTLSPSGAASYTFSGGSAVVSPSVTTNYSVTGTSTAGCVSTSAAIATVTVNAIPVITVNSGAVCNGQSYTLSPSGAASYTFSGGSAVVSPSVTTNYSVTGTSAAGCISSSAAVATITVNASPVITVNSGTVCQGQSYTITPSGASTYTYSSGSNVLTALASSTVVSVIGTSSVGCTSSPVNSSITVTPLPNVAAASTASLICVGNSATLTASGATTYSWSTGASTSAIAITPSVTTTYTVTGTSNGCNKVITITQNVSPCLGIVKQGQESGMVSIFPNPTKAQFTIDVKSAAQVRIINLIGEMIMSQKLEAGQHSVDLSSNASGLYLIEVTTNGRTEVIRLIKE